MLDVPYIYTFPNLFEYMEQSIVEAIETTDDDS